MFIRQNNGKLPKKRRTGEFKKLTDAEVASMEAIVGEAFEGFGGARTREDEMMAGEKATAVRELEFPASEESYVFDRGVVAFWGQDWRHSRSVRDQQRGLGRPLPWGR
jgi:hypothetical protein